MLVNQFDKKSINQLYLEKNEESISQEYRKIDSQKKR